LHVDIRENYSGNIRVSGPDGPLFPVNIPSTMVYEEGFSSNGVAAIFRNKYT
jgi:hypothetical protein